MRSHSGGALSLGKGVMHAASRKQKLNTKSSTEAELVAVDDLMPQILWTRYFLTAQGFQVNDNILFQDNQSTMKLSKNRRASSGKRTRHINIRYFFITDRIKSGEVDVKYCPTELLVGDYYSKPLQGALFRQHRDFTLNTGSGENELLSSYFPRRRNKESMKTSTNVSSQECVEQNTKQFKKVRLNLNEDRMEAKSRSYAHVCGSTNCDESQTKYIVGRYKPALLTKLNNAKNPYVQRLTVRSI